MLRRIWCRRTELTCHCARSQTVAAGTHSAYIMFVYFDSACGLLSRRQFGFLGAQTSPGFIVDPGTSLFPATPEPRP